MRVDKVSAAVTQWLMVTFRPALRARGRAPLSRAAALLLLLRALLFILAPDAPAVFAAGVEPASSFLCEADSAGEPRAPHHRPGERHCPICLLGDRHRVVDAALPRCERVDAPRADADGVISHSFSRAGPAPRACGWIGSWSSRAPPRG